MADHPTNTDARAIPTWCAATGAAIGLALLATPAQAHHMMDGQMPRTFAQGLLSGLGHPIIGLDHLAFVVGIGIVAALAGLGVRLPILFVGFMCAGLGLHLAGVDIPGVEVLIAASVVLVGLAIIWSRAGGSRWVEGSLFALAGTFHGYAFAESIIGAETMPLSAYVVGLIAIQIAIALAAYAVTRAILSQAIALPRMVPRLAGVVILLAGLYFAAGATGLVA